MPMYDKRCSSCERLQLDCWEPIYSEIANCECGGQLERVYLPTTRGQVIGDDIPGGVEIKHALCNADGSPRKYYSKSEIKREADKRGYTNYVVHQPSKGSDKSKWTTKWTIWLLPILALTRWT